MIYTFSTKSSRPKDTEAVKRIKEHCANKGLNFSALVIRLLKEWEAKEAKESSDAG